MWHQALAWPLAALSLLSGCLSIKINDDTAPAAPMSLPSRIPEAPLVPLAGEPVALSAYQGKVIVLSFWASWCKPCKRELPRLEELSTRYGPRGAIFLTVNEDEDPSARDKYLAKSPLSLPIFLDEGGALAKHFGSAQGGLPLTVLISKDFKVAKVDSGFGTGWHDEFTAALDGLLAQ